MFSVIYFLVQNNHSPFPAYLFFKKLSDPLLSLGPPFPTRLLLGFHFFWEKPEKESRYFGKILPLNTVDNCKCLNVIL